MRTPVKIMLGLAFLLVTLSFLWAAIALARFYNNFNPREADYNFNSENADHWITEGGSWSIINKQYIGQGTFDMLSPCGFVTYQTFIPGPDARDVDLSVDMESIKRVDKSIILRSADADHQIELNFRAERPGAFPADLIVQEKVDCQFILHTPEFAVELPPHQIGQTIHVRVLLTGQRLRVWSDETLVLDQVFPFAAQTGRIGLGVIEEGTTTFDNVQVLVIR